MNLIISEPWEIKSVITVLSAKPHRAPGTCTELFHGGASRTRSHPLSCAQRHSCNTQIWWWDLTS